MTTLSSFLISNRERTLPVSKRKLVYEIKTEIKIISGQQQTLATVSGLIKVFNYSKMFKVSGSLLVTIVLLFETVISENVKDNGNNTVDEFSVGNEGSRLLSRRKRFLIFPVGSSLQLGKYVY